MWQSKNMPRHKETDAGDWWSWSGADFELRFLESVCFLVWVTALLRARSWIWQRTVEAFVEAVSQDTCPRHDAVCLFLPPALFAF